MVRQKSSKVNTDEQETAADHIARRAAAVLAAVAYQPDGLKYTQGDSDVISFHIYASWFPQPSCG